MEQPYDPYKTITNKPVKKNRINNSQKSPKSLSVESQNQTQESQNQEQFNWLAQPPDTFREAREKATTEQEHFPSESFPEWRRQQNNAPHPDLLIDSTIPIQEEMFSESSTISSQEDVQKPRSADRENSDKTLDARSLVGTFSIQLLLTDTWKALRNHLKHLLRKRMEDAINFWTPRTTMMILNCRYPKRTVPVKQMIQKPRVIEISAPV
jgi:hypothetical protein